MPKIFSRIGSSGFIPAIVGAKTTIVNAGPTSIYVVDDDTQDAMKDLSPNEQKAVLKALYAIEPGKSKNLAAGSYFLDLGDSLQPSVILIVEKAAKPPVVVPPVQNPPSPDVTPVVDENPPAEVVVDPPVENPPASGENPPATQTQD